MLLGDPTADGYGPVVAALVLMAAVASLVEWGSLAERTWWLPVGEGVLAAIVLMNTPHQSAFLAYLTVPPVVAGVRHGLVTTINAGAMTAITVTITLGVTGTDHNSERLIEAAPWMLAGLAIGVLATLQSRSVRTLEAQQAPFAAAHQLMTQLHSLARQGAVGLNASLLAAELETALRHATGASRSAVFVGEDDSQVHQLSSYGDSSGMLERLSAAESSTDDDLLRVTIGGAVKPLGSVVLDRAGGWSEDRRATVASIVSDYALRLDTALLYDDVRIMAATEERNRIAREMHDGVAQEIVALGYIVDEIESISQEAETQSLAKTLREEISRVVAELRFSIFDLRHEMAEHQLSGALAEYVREVSHGSELRVHLLLDESGPALPRRVEVELLRVAQEAIGNVRKHAQASNLWVQLESDGMSIRLTIEDDGIGDARPRERHWGLQTMSERANCIGAELTISPRPGGGTVVSLQSRNAPLLEGTVTHGHHSSAR
jgi:signal transduction histidine kinase